MCEKRPCISQTLERTIFRHRVGWAENLLIVWQFKMPQHFCHILYNIWLFYFTSYFHTEDLCSNYHLFKAEIKHKNCCDVSIILASASSYSVAVNIQQIKVYSWHYFQCGIKKNQINALWVSRTEHKSSRSQDHISSVHWTWSYNRS